MKQSISLPQIPKNLQTDNKELYDYLFGLQQALLAKQTDDYSAVDKTSTDLTSFIANNKASQAQAIAGTLDTKIITPKSLRQGFNASGSAPVFACRAWVNFDGTTNTDGYCTIRASGNVSSVADNGTGDYTINFTTPMEDINFSMIGTCSAVDSEHLADNTAGCARTTSSIRISSVRAGVGLRDSVYTNVAIFR